MTSTTTSIDGSVTILTASVVRSPSTPATSRSFVAERTATFASSSCTPVRSAIRLASVSRERATAAPTLPHPSMPTRMVGRPASVSESPAKASSRPAAPFTPSPPCPSGAFASLAAMTAKATYRASRLATGVAQRCAGESRPFRLAPGNRRRSAGGARPQGPKASPADRRRVACTISRKTDKDRYRRALPGEKCTRRPGERGRW